MKQFASFLSVTKAKGVSGLGHSLSRMEAGSSLGSYLKTTRKLLVGPIQMNMVGVSLTLGSFNPNFYNLEQNMCYQHIMGWDIEAICEE